MPQVMERMRTVVFYRVAFDSGVEVRRSVIKPRPAAPPTPPQAAAHAALLADAPDHCTGPAVQVDDDLRLRDVRLLHESAAKDWEPVSAPPPKRQCRSLRAPPALASKPQLRRAESPALERHEGPKALKWAPSPQRDPSTPPPEQERAPTIGIGSRVQHIDGDRSALHRVEPPPPPTLRPASPPGRAAT